MAFSAFFSSGFERVDVVGSGTDSNGWNAIAFRDCRGVALRLSECVESGFGSRFCSST